MNHKFPKSEKLKSSKTIESLFLEGKTHFKYPIKVFFLSKENLEANLAAFAVPKRKFKLAVDRNRVKRQLRETYRLNKHTIEEGSGTKFVQLYLYLGKAKPQYQELEKAMKYLLKKLNEERSLNTN